MGPLRSRAIPPYARSGSCCTQNAKIQHGGLSKAMARYKLQFVGKAHRADVDALNTLRLSFTILERQRLLEACAARMKNL